MRLCSLFLLSICALASALEAQDTVRFTPTVQQPTFAVREPVLRIRPGTVLVSQTNFGDYYTEAGGAFPGEVGPIYIEGATTNDILVVEVIRVQPNHHLAASRVQPNFGGLATSMDVILRIDLLRGKTIDWPRLEDADYIMVAGSARPLIDAFRLAHVELVEWLVED